MVRDVAKPDLGSYFETHDEAAVQDPRRSPATWIEGAEGRDWFKVTSQDPNRVSNFAAGMEFAKDFIPVLGLYPFERLVDDTFPEDLPLIVDVEDAEGRF